MIIDGALAAAAAVGADRIVLAAHRGSSAVAQLTAALSRTHTEIAEIEVCEIPARFVASEASAVVNFVKTGNAAPQESCIRCGRKESTPGRPWSAMPKPSPTSE